MAAKVNPARHYINGWTTGLKLNQEDMEVTMELRLTDKEHELLLDLLAEQQKHLLHEINKAHHHDAKITLRQRCTMVEGILQRLNEHVTTTA